MKQRISLKQILLLQMATVLYTVSGIMSKFASAGDSWQQVSLFFGLALFFLGVYALCWQQMIKRLPLSVAYANRAIALLWSTLWALSLFKETVTGRQLMGIALVVLGICVINRSQGGEEA